MHSINRYMNNSVNNKMNENVWGNSIRVKLKVKYRKIIANILTQNKFIWNHYKIISV